MLQLQQSTSTSTSTAGFSLHALSLHEKTPCVELLGAPDELQCCSQVVDIQPAVQRSFGRRVWQSSATVLLEDGGDDGDIACVKEEERRKVNDVESPRDIDVDDAASIATSEENPMQSAPVSPRLGELHVDGQWSGASHASSPPTTKNQQKQSNEDYHVDAHKEGMAGDMKHTMVEVAGKDNARLARRGVGILQGSAEWVQRMEHDGGVRASKRVSFSLPNSPRESSSDTRGDEEGNVGGGDEEAPVPGLDLGVAAQLVANADRLRRSWQREEWGHEGVAVCDELQGALSAECDHHQEGSSPPTPSGSSLELDSGEKSLPSVEAFAQHDAAKAGSSSIESRAAEIISKALLAEMRESLPGLPGVPAGTLPGLPLAVKPLNIDVFMAAVIANAGNTPTGPLARGVRSGDEHLFDNAAAKALRQVARAREASAAPKRKALLEPIVPAPLGMGVRASETVAQGISPVTLRQSLEAHLSLRPRQPLELGLHHTASSRDNSTAPTDDALGLATQSQHNHSLEDSGRWDAVGGVCSQERVEEERLPITRQESLHPLYPTHDEDVDGVWEDEETETSSPLGAGAGMGVSTRILTRGTYEWDWMLMVIL